MSQCTRLVRGYKELPGKPNEEGVVLYSSLRGTGLLVSAFGATTARPTCNVVIEQLLSARPKSTADLCDSVIVGIDFGPVQSLLPNLVKTEDKAMENTSSAPTRLGEEMQWHSKGLQAIPDIERSARSSLQRNATCEKGMVRVMCCDALPGAPGGAIFTATSRHLTDPTDMYADFTDAVKAEMRQMGDQYAKLCDMHAQGTLQCDARKPIVMILQ